MRTTVDLPDDLYRQLTSIAQATSRSLSDTAAEMIRRGLGRPGELSRSTRTGLPVVHLGAVIATDDVWALEGESEARHR